MKKSSYNPIPRAQAAVGFSQAAPVQNTWYTALNVTSRSQLISFVIGVATANETLEWRIVSNGVVLDAIGLACTAGTQYQGYLYAVTAGELNCRLEALAALRHAVMWEDVNMLIQYRKTTATGAGTITGRVVYKLFS